MALGPGDWDSQLVTAGGGGDVRYTDFRLVPEDDSGAASAQMGAWKSVRAEDRGPLSAFASHPYAPLLATASLSQNAQVSNEGQAHLRLADCLLPTGAVPHLCCMKRKICEHQASSPQCHLANVSCAFGGADGEAVGPARGHAGLPPQLRCRRRAAAQRRRQPHRLAPLPADICVRRRRPDDQDLRGGSFLTGASAAASACPFSPAPVLDLLPAPFSRR